jgi:2-iminoacetate synthase ThiH
VKMGVRACQTILDGGANDFGGTLMEETISRMAGAEWGIRMEPSQLRDAITSIGRVPVERSTTYEPLQRNSLTHASNGARGVHEDSPHAKPASNR